MSQQTKFEWFLLYCKPHEEQRCLLNLQNQGVEAFYPKTLVTRKRKGTVGGQSELLFPNYLFAKLDPESANFNAIRSTRGVSDFVRFGRQYARVSQYVIECLKSISTDKSEFLSDPGLPEHSGELLIERDVNQLVGEICQTSRGMDRSMLLFKMLEQSTPSRKYSAIS